MSEHEHASCSCSCCHEPEHHHKHTENHGCGCSHEHHEHDCGCGHEHHDHDAPCSCGCGHEHHVFQAPEFGCSCGCGHDHGHDHEHSSKGTVARIAAAAVLLIVAALLPLTGWLRLLVFLVPYLVIGWDVLWRAARNIAKGKVFDENFLMALATVGALAIGEYPEAVFVMLFYQVGELFQSCAVGKSRKNIAALMDIRPDHANVVQ